MIADDVCSLSAVSTNHIFCYIHTRLHKSYPPLHSPSVVARWHPWSFCGIPTLWLQNDHWNAEKSTKECMRMTPAHSTWENTTISPGLARLTDKFTVKMKPRRILHEKTQRFLRGWREWQINVQSRWRPGAFYMRKHNDFSAVGGTRTYISRKLIVEMKPRRILHEKTQRFLGGWRDAHVQFT